MLPLGQDDVLTALDRAIQAGRLAHALMFVGPDGVGRETVARHLAALMLCSTPNRGPPASGCGVCHACVRVRSGSHPDLVWVMSEAEAARRGSETSGGRTPSRDIRVDDVRALASLLQQRPYEGRARVVIVVEAQAMNERAQNALLKALEEPAHGNHVILLVPHTRVLLATIASRAQVVRFRPLDETTVELILKSQQVADAHQKSRGASSLAGLGEDPRAEQVNTLDNALGARSLGEVLSAVEAMGKDRSDVIHAASVVMARCAERARHAAANNDDAGVENMLRALSALQLLETRLSANTAVALALEEALLRAATGHR
jgi:DNA polymerase III subunit delta'